MLSIRPLLIRRFTGREKLIILPANARKEPIRTLEDGLWAHALIEPGYDLDVVVEHVRFRVEHRAQYQNDTYLRSIAKTRSF